MPALTHADYSRARLLRLLEDLDRSAPRPGRRTIALPAGTSPKTLAFADQPLWPALAPYAARSDLGVYAFLDPDHGVLVVPPLPVEHELYCKGFDTAPVRELLNRRPCVAAVLLRLGGYAVGVYEGDELIDSRNDSRFVKNRHRKGGQSQRRFDRIREKQIHEQFENLCEMAQARLAPYTVADASNGLDYVVYGGDAHTVQAFLKTCRWLRELSVPVLPRFLTVPEPRHQTLVGLPHTLWSSRVIVAIGAPEGP